MHLRIVPETIVGKVEKTVVPNHREGTGNHCIKIEANVTKSIKNYTVK